MNIILASKQILPSTETKNIIGNSLGYDLTIAQSGKIHNLSTKTKIEGLGPCVGLIMWAGKNKFEAHSAPELETISHVGKRINKIVENLREKLRNSFDEVHAFITGGIEYNPDNPISQQSKDLLNEIYDALKKENVPSVFIAGQRNDGLKTRLDTLSVGDNIFVFGKTIDNVIESKKSLADSLDEQFYFVELNKYIPVTISK